MDKVQEKKRPYICKHDQLGRSCNICDLEEEVQDLQYQLDAAKQENERLQKHIEKIERAGYV